MEFTRIDCQFPSADAFCSAWLYQPKDTLYPPLVIMAHGFGGLKVCGLEPFAEEFAAAGIAVLLFDYRGFGDSGGTPRNLISPKKHLQDWQAAVAYARQLKGIDHKKIALWGTSFSGGHAAVTAARDKGIAAVIMQVPFLDGIASSTPIIKENGVGYLWWALSSALRDAWRALTSQEPYSIQLYGTPDERAVLNTPGTKEGYESLIPPGLQLENACPARIMLTMLQYRPIKTLGNIKCPVLIIAGLNDNLIPIASIKKGASKIKGAELECLPYGHFDIYQGEPFEGVIRHETYFLKTHLIK